MFPSYALFNVVQIHFALWPVNKGVSDNSVCVVCRYVRGVWWSAIAVPTPAWRCCIVTHSRHSIAHAYLTRTHAYTSWTRTSPRYTSSNTHTHIALHILKTRTCTSPYTSSNTYMHIALHILKRAHRPKHSQNTHMRIDLHILKTRTSPYTSSKHAHAHRPTHPQTRTWTYRIHAYRHSKHNAHAYTLTESSNVHFFLYILYTSNRKHAHITQHVKDTSHYTNLQNI